MRRLAMAAVLMAFASVAHAQPWPGPGDMCLTCVTDGTTHNTGTCQYVYGGTAGGYCFQMCCEWMGHQELDPCYVPDILWPCNPYGASAVKKRPKPALRAFGPDRPSAVRPIVLRQPPPSRQPSWPPFFTNGLLLTRYSPFSLCDKPVMTNRRDDVAAAPPVQQTRKQSI